MACSEEASNEISELSSDSWYEKWLAEGDVYITDLELAPGSHREITVSSSDECSIGFITEKGYEISKDTPVKYVYIGLTKDDRSQGASIGTWRDFKSSDGLVVVHLTNESRISTRIVVYKKQG